MEYIADSGMSKLSRRDKTVLIFGWSSMLIFKKVCTTLYNKTADLRPFVTICITLIFRVKTLCNDAFAQLLCG